MKKGQSLSDSLAIIYGFHASLFGECLVALTEQGVCHFSFVDSTREQSLELLQDEWPEYELHEYPAETKKVVEALFGMSPDVDVQVHVHVRGTDFQVQVWDALLAIPRGTTVSYQELAKNLGQPSATRAVASAVARNKIAFIIPCHRVISASGKPHKYRWGADRKKALLAWEKQNRSS